LVFQGKAFFMTDMKIPFFTGIVCIVLGIGIIVGAGVALPFINSTLNNLQSTVSAYLTKADNALLSAQNAINSTQVTLLYLRDATNISLPALSSSGELTSNIANNLTAIGSTVTGAGQTLGSISIAGVSPFGSVGTTISSIGQPITDAASKLQSVSSSISSIRQQAADVPNRINGITVQLENVNSSLGDLRASVIDAENQLPGYFNTIWLVSVLAIVGVMGLGAIFLLLGLSLLSLRHKTLENTKSIYLSN
jgi:hypothetical protein